MVAIPSRDICAFCDVASDRGVDALRDLIARTAQAGKPLLCDKLFLRRAGRWEQFTGAKPELAPLEFKL